MGGQRAPGASLVAVAIAAVLAVALLPDANASPASETGSAAAAAAKARKCRKHPGRRAHAAAKRRRCRPRHHRPRRRGPLVPQAVAAPPETIIDFGPNGATNDPTPTFAFHSTVAGATFACSIDAGAAAFGACSGPAEHTPPTQLADGSYTFRVAASGPGGADPSPATRAFVVDTTPPPAALTTPADGTTTSDNRPTLSGSAGTAPGDSQSVSVSLHAGTTASGAAAQVLAGGVSGGSWTVRSSSALADGTYTAVVRQTDSAGNTGASAPRTFTVDASAPQTVIISAPEGRVPIGQVQIGFSSDAGDASFECRLDAEPFKACVSPFKIPTPTPGPHRLEVAAVNRSAVADPTPAKATWSSVEPVHNLCIDQPTGTATIGPEYATLYTLSCPLLVDGVLTLAPGTVIKSEFGGVYVADQGFLRSEGTSAEPVVLTSLAGDSEEWFGIQVQEGSVFLDHTRVERAFSGVTGNEPDQFVIRDSIFRHTFEAGVLLTANTSPVVPSISGNIVTDTPNPAMKLHAKNLDLKKLVGNDGSADGGGIRLSGVITADGTMSMGTLVPEIGVGWDGPETLRIGPGATVTVPPGQVVKGSPRSFPETGSVPHPLRVEGELIADGTALEPVTFTASVDDSAAGDTNNDGGATSPAPGDWAGVIVANEGSAVFDHTDLRYAETAITALGGAEVEVRGSLRNNSTDIHTCDWATTCAVDAAYVDWGAEAGPTSPARVCGAVAVSPFLFSGSTHPAGSLPKDCDGSANPWEALVAGQQAFGLAIAGADEEAVDAALECMSTAFAGNAAGLPFAFDDPFADGVSGSGWPTAGTDLGNAGAQWLTSSAESEIATPRGLQIVNLGKALAGVAAAYGSCEP